MNDVIRMVAPMLLLALLGCAPTIQTQVTADGKTVAFPRTEEAAIDYYFSNRDLDRVEGIWTWHDNKYKIAIIKNTTGIESDYDYAGVIIRASAGSWSPGKIKLFLNSTAAPAVFTGVYFAGNQARTNTSFLMDNENVITVSKYFSDGQPMMIRDYPVGHKRVAARGTESHGTCFLTSPNGVAITSYHVIDGADEVSVTLADGKQVPAVVESTSAANDIAVLRLAASTPDYLSFSSTRSSRLGDQVFTVGFPSKSILGADAKFTEGSISALSGVQGEASYMQISIPIQPGNSGGPVVNHKGEVVGVIAATAAVEVFYRATGSLPQNVNWAVKSDYVQPMLEGASTRPAATDRNEAILRVQKAVCQVTALL